MKSPQPAHTALKTQTANLPTQGWPERLRRRRREGQGAEEARHRDEALSLRIHAQTQTLERVSAEQRSTLRETNTSNTRMQRNREIERVRGIRRTGALHRSSHDNARDMVGSIDDKRDTERLVFQHEKSRQRPDV